MKTYKQIIAEVNEPKSGDEKRFKDKHVVQKNEDPAGNKDDVFKGSKVEKDKTKKASYKPGEDEEVHEEKEEESDTTEGRRPKSKDGEEEEGGEHIAMQLRKAITMRGQKKVKFNDGKEVKVSVRDADKFFNKFNKTRMAADKLKMTRDAAKSYDAFKKIIDEELTERALTDTEMKRREEIAKDLPDKEFKDRYGDDWKSVKMATATKMAKKESADEVNELSRKTLGNYISKASDASKNRRLSVKKVDNRHTGVSRAVKRLDKMEEAVDVAKTLQKASKASKGISVKFDDGSTENIDKNTAKQLLDIHKKLNTTNKKKLEKNLFKSSEDFMKMVDFAMKRA